MPLGMEVGLGLSDFVLDGDPAPVPKRGRSLPNFRPISIVAKRLDRCIARGMEVGLGPGHIVLDGDPATLPKKVRAPNFRPISIVAKWLDGSKMPLGTEVGLGLGKHCVT